MKAELINTPYGRKTPELLCRAMDALQREPELLEACKRLLAGEAKLTGESAGDVENWNAYRQIEAAVAKAEGRVEP